VGNTMKVTEHIKNANGKTLFSFEIIPPKKGNSINQLYNNIDPLMEFNPPFTKEETEYLLVDCHYLGINNVMALRGDAMKHQQYFEARNGGHLYAKELVSQIQNLNEGQYLHDVLDADDKSDFCIVLMYLLFRV